MDIPNEQEIKAVAALIAAALMGLDQEPASKRPSKVQKIKYLALGKHRGVPTCTLIALVDDKLMAQLTLRYRQPNPVLPEDCARPRDETVIEASLDMLGFNYESIFTDLARIHGFDMQLIRDHVIDVGLATYHPNLERFYASDMFDPETRTFV